MSAFDQVRRVRCFFPRSSEFLTHMYVRCYVGLFIVSGRGSTNKPDRRLPSIVYRHLPEQIVVQSGAGVDVEQG